MHFSNVAAVLSLLGLVSAAPLAARSAADVEKDITTVQGEVDKLDGDIKAFTGSIIQALGLLSDFNSLKSSIDTATTDATNAGTLSAGDSDTIYGDLNTLSGHISTTLNDGIAQAATVKNAGYGSEVHDALQALQGKADGFFAIIKKDSDPSDTSKVTALQQQVDSDFTAAIAAYA